MHPDHIEHVARFLLEVSDRTAIGNIVQTQDRRSWRVNGDQLVSIPHADAISLEATAIVLASDKTWGTKWSSDYILLRLVERLHGIKLMGFSAAKAVIENLDRHFHEFEKVTSMNVPIANLIMEIDEIRIGSVTFRRNTPEYRDQARAYFSEFHQRLPPEVKEQVPLEMATDVLVRPMKWATTAVFSTVADPELAMHRGLTEIRRVLEILTLAAAHLFHDRLDGNLQLSIDGEVPTSGPSITYEFDGYPTAHQRNYDSFFPMTIVEQSWSAFEALGIADLFHLLEQPAVQLNDLEKSILRSIHWFAVSQGQLELENRLLNLTTAVECLLTQSENYSISNQVAEGMAVFLHKDFNDFVDIRDFVKSMYKARSKVSHGGIQISSLADITRFRRLVCRLIMFAWSNRDQYRSREALHVEFERRRIAGLQTA